MYDLRADLHRDVGERTKHCTTGEWKEATVLAGSIVEALLLWGLQNRKQAADIEAAAVSLGKKVNLTSYLLEK